jgi:hypothetical protein
MSAVGRTTSTGDDVIIPKVKVRDERFVSWHA